METSLLLDLPYRKRLALFDVNLLGAVAERHLVVGNGLTAALSKGGQSKNTRDTGESAGQRRTH
ncbi:MAG: hypothetical protein GXO73_09340 [Calditrichaeota bacterium]|nr:hypothetical protein [Calditrichota bacterium]